MTLNSFEKVVKSNIDKFHISQELKDFFLSPRPAVIFGCGVQGRIGWDFCHMFHKEIFSFCVSDSGKRQSPFGKDVPIFSLSSFPVDIKDNVDVIIQVNSQHNEHITQLLVDHGFKNIYKGNDWSKINAALRKDWFELYFAWLHTKYGDGFVFEKDKNDRKYMHFVDGKIDFRMYYPEDDLVIQSNLLGNAADILLPSLFDEVRYVSEGPYEYGNVRLG